MTKLSFTDLFTLVGCGAVSYGFWLAWHPLGFIAGGVSASAVGVLLGRQVRNAQRAAVVRRQS